MYITTPRRFMDQVNLIELYSYVIGDTDSIKLGKQPKYTVTYTYNAINTPFINSTFFNNTLDNITMRYVREQNESPNEFSYSTFHIPKATGGTRKITAPSERLKLFQREIINVLEYVPITQTTRYRVFPHNAAFAYCEKRDTKVALELHQRNKSKWFLKLDIKDFFPTFNKELINKLRKSIHPWCYVSDRVWGDMVDILLLPDGTLPQGSPASPYLTNILFKKFDYLIMKQLNEVYNNKYKDKFVYTRYADDLLISMRHKLNQSDLDYLIAMIKNVLGNSFKIKNAKTRYGSSHGSNWNLGLILNKDNNITIGYKNKRDVNAMLNNIFRHAFNDSWNEAIGSNFASMLGKINYLNKIEPNYYNYIVNKYELKYNKNWKAIIKVYS